MRQFEFMTVFFEDTGREVTGIGTVSVKRGKVRIIFKKDDVNIRIYWDQDGTERELIHEDSDGISSV